jgi:hypothetical protein
MRPIVCWVVALRVEAEPLIAKLQLRASGKGGGLFPLYSSLAGDVCLVISGIGKVNAAAATAYLAASLPEDAMVGWINFGIAGSGQVPYGRLVQTGSILDEATGRRWFPGAPLSRKNALERKGVITVDHPREEYPEGDTVIEMEAAGFYPTALRCSSIEFCQVLKVVSDGPGNPVSLINKQVVGELCEAATTDLEPWLGGFHELLHSEAELAANPPGYEEWLAATRFSVTQGFQLRRLLQEWRALGIAENPAPGAPAGDRGLSAREALAGIRGKLANFRKELQNEREPSETAYSN